MFQALTNFFSGNSARAETVSDSPQETPDGEKLVTQVAPFRVDGASLVTEGFDPQSFGRTHRAKPDAHIIYGERQLRRDLKEQFFAEGGALNTTALNTLVERLNASKQREENAANRIRAKAAGRLQAKEARRQQLLARMEAKKQPHLKAIAQIEDKIRRAGF